MRSLQRPWVVSTCDTFNESRQLVINQDIDGCRSRHRRVSRGCSLRAPRSADKGNCPEGATITPKCTDFASVGSFMSATSSISKSANWVNDTFILFAFIMRILPICLEYQRVPTAVSGSSKRCLEHQQVLAKASGSSSDYPIFYSSTKHQRMPTSILQRLIVFMNDESSLNVF